MSRQALEEILDRRVGGRGVAGLAVAIGARPDRDAVWVPGSLEEEPAFLTYSISKTFTAVLILLLQEEGRVSLEDPLARWFPGSAASERISLRRLLNHTAGVPDYGALRSYQDGVRRSPSVPWTFERFAAGTHDQGLTFEPGSGWGYSNPGYMLLKGIAEEVTGSSYAELISRRIARSLGLTRTFVPESVEDLASLAPASSCALSPDGTPRDPRTCYHPGWVSHGVVASTPSEISRFLHGVFRGRLVSRRSLEEMTTLVPVPAAPPRWTRPGYGLGLMGDRESPWGPIWGHSGAGPGYSASVFHAPGPGDRCVTAGALCGLEEGSIAEELVFAVLERAAEGERLVG